MTKREALPQGTFRRHCSVSRGCAPRARRCPVRWRKSQPRSTTVPRPALPVGGAVRRGSAAPLPAAADGAAAAVITPKPNLPKANPPNRRRPPWAVRVLTAARRRRRRERRRRKSRRSLQSGSSFPPASCFLKPRAPPAPRTGCGAGPTRARRHTWEGAARLPAGGLLLTIAAWPAERGAERLGGGRRQAAACRPPRKPRGEPSGAGRRCLSAGKLHPRLGRVCSGEGEGRRTPSGWRVP